MEKKKTTRRKFIKAASGIGVSLGLLPLGCNVSENNEKAKVLAIIGDRFHNSDYIRNALSKIFVEEEGIAIDFTDEVNSLNKENLNGYRVLIIFRDGYIWPDGYGANAWWAGYQVRDEKRVPFEIIDSWYPGYQTIDNLPVINEPEVKMPEPVKKVWMTKNKGQVVKDFIKNGGSGLFYHNAGFIAIDNTDFSDVLGAIAKGHPPIRPFKVEITDISHPVTRGVNDFIVTDEQHFLEYHLDPAYVFMRSINTDGLTHDLAGMGNSSVAGWSRDFGKGKVCFLAPGHTIDALWNSEYKKLQKNAMNWLLE